ncbi:MAG: hypothetical protein PVI90_02365 [Desulfobacteraceae bacterium]|jgi:hypothetical protein
MDRPNRYTCNEYRQEMMLIGLKRQLQKATLSEEEREDLQKKINQLESEMDIC